MKDDLQVNIFKIHTYHLCIYYIVLEQTYCEYYIYNTK